MVSSHDVSLYYIPVHGDGEGYSAYLSVISNYTKHTLTDCYAWRPLTYPNRTTVSNQCWVKWITESLLEGPQVVSHWLNQYTCTYMCSIYTCIVQ